MVTVRCWQVSIRWNAWRLPGRWSDGGFCFTEDSMLHGCLGSAQITKKQDDRRMVGWDGGTTMRVYTKLGWGGVTPPSTEAQVGVE